MKKIIVNIAIPFVILLLPFFTPFYSTSIDISTLITVVSLLFAILVGFFIATASQNYLRLQTLAATEESCLMALFNLCKLIDPSSKEKVANAVDKYTVAIQSYEFIDYIDKTNNEFNELVDVVDKINIKDKMDSAIIQYLHEKKVELFGMRQEMALVARRIITRRHWSIIILLASIIAVLLFMLRDGTVSSNLISGVLTTSLYFILILVYEVDANRFAEEKLAFLNADRIFNFIGKLPYYTHEVIKAKRVKEPGESYRLGFKTGNNIEIKTIEK